MRAIVPHTQRLMMVQTAHKLSDFSWIYKGWKIFNENTVEKTIKIDFSPHLLDEFQFCKKKPIWEGLVSRKPSFPISQPSGPKTGPIL
jgi:hypothetical protein